MDTLPALRRADPPANPHRIPGVGTGLSGGACFVSSVALAEAGAHGSTASLALNGLSGLVVSGVPPARAGSVIWHRWVSPRLVPAKHLAFVASHVDYASRLLDFEWPASVRFYLPIVDDVDEVTDVPFLAEEDGEFVAGFAQTRWMQSFGIHAGIRGDIVIAVIAHELQHLKDNAALTHLQPLEAERRAADFAVDYLGSLHRRKVA